MPEDREFEGGRSILPFLMAAAPVGAYGYTKRGAMRAAMGGGGADPMSQVVGARAGAWFAGMEGWNPNISAVDPALQDPMLQAFRRRVGVNTPLGRVASLEEAVAATEGSPALRSILRQSMKEFAGVGPEQIGASIAAGGMQDIGMTLTKPRAVTNAGAMSEALSRNELGMSGAQRRALRTHLEELATVTRDMMDTVPTFQLQKAGDKAVSEMIVNVHRAGGPVSMKIPLPGAEGEIRTATGTRFYARKAMADPRGFLATGTAGEATAAEHAVQRLRELIVEKQGAVSQRDVNRVQAEIRKQLIYTGDERGVLAAESAGRTYSRQMVVPRYRIAGEGAEAKYNISRAEYLKSQERLAGMGRAAGLTPDALSKGIMWTEEGAARLPYGGVTPQHYTQAMTKGQVSSGMAGAELFQVSPAALEAAGGQLGMGAITPRQDVIMMSNLEKGRMKTPITRPVTIDPNMAASRRFERIQQLLRDNKTTADMLRGGATMEETMGAYLNEMSAVPKGRGMAQYQEMAKLRTLGEGEFLGFTESGPKFAKTYGAETMIRDFKTVGGKTEVTLGGFYDPQKVFSTGGIKHSLEYADPESIKRLGVRAKALELLQSRGIDPKTMDPANPAFAAALRRAEVEAEKLYGGAQGIVVEGAGWNPWEKYQGAGKNVGRFNQLVETKWQEKFGALPSGYFETEDLMKRRGMLAQELRRRGTSWSEQFAPELMAVRSELLRPGPAAEMLGIGKPGTFTDDAFRIFRMFGWTNIAEDMASRVQRDTPLQAILEQAVQATRGAKGAVPLADIAARPGGIEAILDDAAARAEFIAKEGGIVQLPQTYKVAGKDISQIAIPHMGTGHTGYFTTPEGREIAKELDVLLKNVLVASSSDVGAAGLMMEDLAGTGPLQEYFGRMGGIATKYRDKIGGTVAGSRTFAIGRELLPEIVSEAGRIPTAAIHPETFEKWLADNVTKGLVSERFAETQQRLFYEGKLAVSAIKHPARGPLSANLMMLGPTPKGQMGWSAQKNFAYLSESLLKPFVADLDFDPMPLDMFTNRSSLAEATKALESGQVGAMISRHETIRRQVLGADIKGAQEGGLRAWFQGQWDKNFLTDKFKRDAAAKTEVGIFTSRLGWPMSAAAEEAGLTMEQKFDVAFWAELMEEKTTLKARHDFTIKSGIAEELADAFQTGRYKTLQDQTRGVLGLRAGQEKYFDDILEKLTTTWKDMSASKRSAYEAVFAGKGRAGAKTFMELAASDTILPKMAGKRRSGIALQAERAFGKMGNALRGHKKGLLLAAGIGTVAAGLIARPRDLTPESVESGKVAGGPQGNMQRLPMPRLEKGLYYKEGTKPGFRVHVNTSKEMDHRAISRQLSNIVGQKPVNIQVNDGRRRITRHDIEREMRSDRVFGGRSSSDTFYNSSRY